MGGARVFHFSQGYNSNNENNRMTSVQIYYDVTVQHLIAQLAGAVEYTDCISAEG